MSNPDPVLSKAELRQRNEDLMPTRTWGITSPPDESDPAALILELESDQRASKDNSRLTIGEKVQVQARTVPRLEIILSDEQSVETAATEAKERKIERRRKRRRETAEATRGLLPEDAYLKDADGVNQQPRGTVEP